MSKIDHRVFTSSAATFSRQAADILQMEDLRRAFADALRAEGVAGFSWSVADAAAPRPGGDRASGGQAIRFAMDAPDGGVATMTMWPDAEPDRASLGRLHLLAILFVTHAVAIEAADDAGHDPGVSVATIERACVDLAAEGRSYVDIADRWGMTPHAVAIHIRRAAARDGGWRPGVTH